ncbi:Divalent cation transporter [uncultured Alphaproteobacteria bacterium]|uniref:Magnesium transporter MgtE n=1 Tax=uncultured Alphaproteobacteria bacterium TaxID=91750 RepID=A0A212KMM2_9PROT|nr:Divalent cation transporter [uncultured Alphaproteobacteria bacterium]
MTAEQPPKTSPETETVAEIEARAAALDIEDAFPDENFTDVLLRLISEAIAEGDMARARELLLDQHYADAADILDRMQPDDRAQLVLALGKDIDPDILPALDEEVRDQVVGVLGVQGIAAAVEAMDSDDAVAVIEQLDDDERRRVIQALPAENRAVIEQALAYPEYSAGRMMQREMIAVPEFWTVGDTLKYIQTTADELPDEFYEVFVVDLRHHPIGRVSTARLLRAAPETPIREIVDADVEPVPAAMDREEVAMTFRDRDWVSAMVVDADGRLIGRITVDDIVDVIDEEAEDDMLRLGGVSDSDIFRAVWGTVRARFTWLLINLGTAMLAASVIGLFEGTIEKMVALAVLMPVVAGMGGNAGTQTLTVTVRALAMKELTPGNARRVIGKELAVGLTNGLVFACLAGTISYVWFGQATIGVVLGCAMVINLTIAALVGILVPLALDRFKVDPAVASGVFLTAITDSLGFFAFLGLATAFLL